MTTNAFIIPRNATDDDIERARPSGAGDSRCHSEPVASPYVSDTAAVNVMPEIADAVPRQERNWRKDITDGLWHAWRAGELSNTWTIADLIREIARQIAEEEELRRGENDDV